MKREEENQQTRRRIMEHALAEFGERGYAASSVNTICAAQDISKGIIYHYFRTKDDLFLACVGECFQRLTEYLAQKMQTSDGSVKDRLEEYFTARMSFFAENPVYQKIFCAAIISPPPHLRAQIQECKKDFDALNVQILQQLLSAVELRPQITPAEVIDTFRQFQDFFNAKYQAADLTKEEFEMHERSCRTALDILLYGVLNRKE